MSVVLQTLWKHHKSKDQTFLHRSYAQKKITPTPTRYVFSEVQYIFRKLENYQQFWFFSRFGFLNNISDFSDFELEKIFFSELRKHFRVQLRCRNALSLDVWCFQSAWSTADMVSSITKCSTMSAKTRVFEDFPVSISFN